MNVIRATVDDVPRVVPCAAEFCKVLGWPLDGDGYVAHLKNVIQADGVIFLLEHEGTVVGGLGGVLHSEPVSGKRMATELFWFVMPEFRRGTGPMRLLASFEKWGHDNGAQHICMLSMEHSMPEEMDRLYRRLGYRKLETTYIK
jgi:GNAT superfamily N-acetyltransferase